MDVEGLIRFMNGPLGRAFRAALGVVLIAYGLFGLGGVGGAIVAVVGAVALTLGIVGRCLIEPFVRKAS